jgi:aspartate 1-decarboxylase
MDRSEAKSYSPTVVMVDGKNKITEIKHGEAHGEIG